MELIMVKPAVYQKRGHARGWVRLVELAEVLTRKFEREVGIEEAWELLFKNSETLDICVGGNVWSVCQDGRLSSSSTFAFGRKKCFQILLREGYFFVECKRAVEVIFGAKERMPNWVGRIWGWISHPIAIIYFCCLPRKK